MAHHRPCVGMGVRTSRPRRTVVSVLDLGVDVTSRRQLAVAALAGVVPATRAAPPGTHELPKVTTTPEWHLARRAAHGPTQEMAEEIERLGAAAWVDRQLKPTSIPDTRLEQMISAHFPWTGTTAGELMPLTNNQPWLGARHLVTETTIRQAYTNRVLFESMVELWSDMLHASAVVDVNTPYVLEYDWDVLRRHALGRYSDLLLGSLTSSAMLSNLTNTFSTQWDVNENYGRELLELHSVGTGEYTEADVKQSSLILTGHTIDYDKHTYRYRSDWHHTGPVKVMGFSHPNATAAGGPAVLTAYARYLATHPATAQKVCRRIAVRFVSDEPSTALVDALAKTYLRAGTNVTPVLRQLFASAEFRESAGAKVRRPAEYVVPMLKACGLPDRLELDDPTWAANTFGNLEMLNTTLEQAGHLPWGFVSVDGPPDVATPWLATNVIRGLWNSAEMISARRDDAMRPTYTTLGLAEGQEVYAAATALTQRLTGYTWDKDNLTRIASWLVGDTGSGTPEVGRTLTSDDVDGCQPAIRQVLSSPYMLIR